MENYCVMSTEFGKVENAWSWMGVRLLNTVNVLNATESFI